MKRSAGFEGGKGQSRKVGPMDDVIMRLSGVQATVGVRSAEAAGPEGQETADVHLVLVDANEQIKAKCLGGEQFTRIGA